MDTRFFYRAGSYLYRSRCESLVSCYCDKKVAGFLFVSQRFIIAEEDADILNVCCIFRAKPFAYCRGKCKAPNIIRHFLCLVFIFIYTPFRRNIHPVIDTDVNIYITFIAVQVVAGCCFIPDFTLLVALEFSGVIIDSFYQFFDRRLVIQFGDFRTGD